MGLAWRIRMHFRTSVGNILSYRIASKNKSIWISQQTYQTAQTMKRKTSSFFTRRTTWKENYSTIFFYWQKICQKIVRLVAIFSPFFWFLQLLRRFGIFCILQNLSQVWLKPRQRRKTEMIIWVKKDDEQILKRWTNFRFWQMKEQGWW